MNNRVHQGHLARKRFGQNFLNNQFVIDSIVSAINPQKGQAMVEIGPGLALLRVNGRNNAVDHELIVEKVLPEAFTG